MQLRMSNCRKPVQSVVSLTASEVYVHMYTPSIRQHQRLCTHNLVSCFPRSGQAADAKKGLMGCRKRLLEVVQQEEVQECSCSKAHMKAEPMAMQP
eukprot:5322604-Pleurochrysis_carterae.AAC.3